MRYVIVLSLLVLAGAAQAQDGGAVPDLGAWVQVFKGVDIAVMTVIGVISYILERSADLKPNRAILVPLILGTAWGIVEATQAGYAPIAIVAKGALLNGGGASIVARLLHNSGLLGKLWPQGEA